MTAQSAYHYKVVSIAGFDPSGGAGLLADVKTFAAFGCYGMAVMTAMTAQNTTGVKGVYRLPLQSVEAQLQVLFDDIRPDAIKIGMLFDAATIGVVVQSLRRNIIGQGKKIPIVLDPVMMAKSGDALLEPAAILSLKNDLLPLTDIITPNLREAEALLGVTTINRTAMPERAAGLLQLGSRAVLLKGGHLLEGDSDDYFLSHTNGGDAAGINAGVDGSHYQPSGKQVIGNGGSVGEWLGGRRIATNNTHGTGCTLSAAIAARAAMGDDLLSACRHAKNYLSGALMAAASSDSQLGHGAGPPHHFYRFW